MANTKISALPAATTINDADLEPIVQGGVTKQITHANKMLSVQTLIDSNFGEAYVEPPANPGSTAFSNGFLQPAQNKLRVYGTGYGLQQVFFRGQLDCSAVTFTPGTFMEVFRLTTPLRPKIEMFFPVIGLYDAIGVCQVSTDGRVYLKNSVGDLLDSGLVDFSNISYFVNQ